MTGFDRRKEIGNEASDAWIDYCITNGYHYAHTGYESWDMSDEFMDAIKDPHVIGIYPYPSWNKIRYFPDWFVIDPLANGFFSDTKNGQGTIERDAYEFYMQLSGKNMDVALVKMKNGNLYSAYIDDIRIQPIPTPLYNGQLPVVEGRWISPRMLPQEKYIEWKEKRKGSGTPFGIIDNFNEFEKLTHRMATTDKKEINHSQYTKYKNISDKFVEFCRSSKREYAFCGVENWQRSESFLPALKKSKSQTCRTIKHFPDLMVIKPYKIFKEKSGGSLIKFIGSDFKIEEDAFKFLLDLDCLGLNIMLITLQNDELKYCPIQMANILDIGTIYKGIPVFENRWATPKKLKSIEYSDWVRKNSDDSFGFIESKCFQKLEP